MRRKKQQRLKKELCLNYTVMLLPHSQAKPIHFKIPVWVFVAAFLSLFTLCVFTLFFSYSTYRLKDVSRQKMVLEEELTKLEAERVTLESEKLKLADRNQQIAEENADLAEMQKEQEEQLQYLESLSDQALKELEDLYIRENEIRSELGMETVEAETPAVEEEEPSPESASFQSVIKPIEEAPKVGLLLQRFGKKSGNYDLRMLENNLLALQNGMRRQEADYDEMGTEIKEAVSAREMASLRQRVVDYALQFVGNAYVYGGNDPHSGVDCSGFSRYVLSHVAGVFLDRTAAAQSQQGRRVDISQAQPGDLIFYGSGSHVSHVAIYMGNGQVVHASNERIGITVSVWNYREPIVIKNVIN